MSHGRTLVASAIAVFREVGSRNREKGKRIHQTVFDDLMGALKEVADWEWERHGHDDLADVAIAGLRYARALTSTDNFSLARSSRAYGTLLEVVMQYAHRREKETPAHPSEPIDTRRLRALLNAFLEASRSGAALASCKAATASLAARSPCA